MTRRPYPGGVPSSLRTAHRLGALLLLPFALASLNGCLWEPKIEDQWTRVDLASASVVPGQVVTAGSSLTLTGRATVTYRRILTGVVVAELRSASNMGGASAIVHPDADREAMAATIDQILAGSTGLGRDTRLVTGWDHLIQPFDFSFSGTVPAALDSTGAPVGLFLLCYLANGTEIELPDGSDSLVVTPMASGQYQVLPVGMALTLTGP